MTLLSLLTACDANKITGTPDPAAKDFSLIGSNLNVEQGKSGTLYIFSSGQNNFMGTITMTVSGNNPGITLDYPAIYNYPGNSSFSMLVKVDSATPVGKYTYTVTGKSGKLEHSTTATVTVSAPANPTNPTNPANPTNPINPTTPTNPANPTNPSTPIPNHPSYPHGFKPPCVSPYLIKGNVSSTGEHIYHVPDGAYYSRTDAEVCFITESDARADGFRKSSR